MCSHVNDESITINDEHLRLLNMLNGYILLGYTICGGYKENKTVHFYVDVYILPQNLQFLPSVEGWSPASCAQAESNGYKTDDDNFASASAFSLTFLTACPGAFLNKCVSDWDANIIYSNNPPPNKNLLEEHI